MITSLNTILSLEVDDITARIIKLQEEDNELKLLRRAVQDKNDERHSLHNGVLYKFVDGIDLLMVPASMETDVIKNAHEKGHGPAKNTQDVIKQEYYITHLKNGQTEEHIWKSSLCNYR